MIVRSTVQVAEHGHRWKMFGDLMCRLPNTVRNCYYESVRSHEKGMWTAEEEQALKNAVQYAFTGVRARHT